MELTFDFEVAVPVEQAWAVLTDVERIAPCLPGAELQEVEGDEYRGVVKVKVGPITASYKGAAHFLEQDATAHRGVLKAEGRETRGQGNASATITAQLAAVGDDRTKVEIVTDLAITGKVAQFGRGMLAEVSGKLLEQFVHNLETMVLAPSGANGSAETSEETVPDAAPVKPAKAAAKSTRSRSSAKTAASAAASDPEPSGAAAGDETATGERAGISSKKAAAEGDTGSPGSGTTGQPEGAPTESPAPAAGAIRQIQSAPAQPVDLGRIAGPSLAKRILPFASIAGAIFLARIVIYALRRRRK